MAFEMPKHKQDGFAVYRFARLLQEYTKNKIDINNDSLETFITNQEDFFKRQNTINPAVKSLIESIKAVSNDAMSELQSRHDALNQGRQVELLQALSAASEDMQRNGIFARNKSFVVIGPSIRENMLTVERAKEILAEITDRPEVFSVEGLGSQIYVKFPQEYFTQEKAYLFAHKIKQYAGDRVSVYASEHPQENRKDTNLLDDLLTKHDSLYKAREGKPIHYIHENVFGHSLIDFKHDDPDLHYDVAYDVYMPEDSHQYRLATAFVKEHEDAYEGLYQRWVSTALTEEKNVSLEL